MTIDSPLFDKIRIKPKGRTAQKSTSVQCEYPGCCEPGVHKAPKGRRHEGEYWHFCVAHVKEYNSSYNYFDGMSDDAVQAYQKDSMIGHRPTWSMGSSQSQDQKRAQMGMERDWAYSDPLGIAKDAMLNTQETAQVQPRRRKVPETIRKALEVMDLDDTADATTIRITYKSLVKKFHPDAHGGDRGFEDRLREIIKAHATLKAAGFC